MNIPDRFGRLLDGGPTRLTFQSTVTVEDRP